MGNDSKTTWNNEADAFKHTYMQAVSTYRYLKVGAYLGGELHEINGNKHQGQPYEEEAMDKWNNKIGRDIGDEVRIELFKLSVKKRKIFSKREVKDYIAEKVMQKLRAGELITSPFDKRIKQNKSKEFSDTIREKYKNNQNNDYLSRIFRSHITNNSNNPNGHWVTIDGNHVFIENT